MCYSFSVYLSRFWMYEYLLRKLQLRIRAGGRHKEVTTRCANSNNVTSFSVFPSFLFFELLHLAVKLARRVGCETRQSASARSGSTEERLSFCEETYDEIDATKAENAYVYCAPPHNYIFSCFFL